jgi:hypothetical protein
MQMPAFADVLAHLADSLRNNGAQIAPSVLDVMSAATTFLVATGNAVDGEIAAAPYLAAQLRSEDAKKAAVGLGVSPDLIPALSPDGLDNQLANVLARSTPPQALVAATVMFSLHAVASRSGNGRRAEALREAAATATLQGSQNQPLARTRFQVSAYRSSLMPIDILQVGPLQRGRIT